jgi:hypothetical protein
MKPWCPQGASCRHTANVTHCLKVRHEVPVRDHNRCTQMCLNNALSTCTVQDCNFAHNPFAMIKNNLAIGRNWDQIGEILLRFTKEVLYSIQEFEDFTENGYDEGAEQDAQLEEANLEIEASELFELV